MGGGSGRMGRYIPVLRETGKERARRRRTGSWFSYFEILIIKALSTLRQGNKIMSL